jgi:hypothetical protein
LQVALAVEEEVLVDKLAAAAELVGIAVMSLVKILVVEQALSPN